MTTGCPDGRICYTSGDHVTCADLRAGRTAIDPCNCPCHDHQRPRTLHEQCESEIFDEAAINLIYARSGGIPRRINQICDISLLTGMTRQSTSVTDSIIREAVESLEH